MHYLLTLICVAFLQEPDSIPGRIPETGRKEVSDTIRKSSTDSMPVLQPDTTGSRMPVEEPQDPMDRMPVKELSDTLNRKR